MRPTLTSDNSTNGTTANRVFDGQFALKVFSGCILLANLYYLLCGQFCASALLASWNALWVLSWPAVFAFGHSPFAPGVFDVVKLSAQAQMVRVYAARVIADVKAHKFGWPYIECEPVGYAMRFVPAVKPVELHSAVAVVIKCTQIRPTFGSAFFSNSAPKPFNLLRRVVRWDKLRRSHKSDFSLSGQICGQSRVKCYQHLRGSFVF